MERMINGIKVRIPKGYHSFIDESGVETFINNHGVEYGLVVYGWKGDATPCLETINSKHVRSIQLETV